jgi:hypothetical protein
MFLSHAYQSSFSPSWICRFGAAVVVI